MDNELANKVLNLIIELWPIEGNRLRSEQIYKRLVESGEDIPYGALHQIFIYLQDTNCIRISQHLADEYIQMHGNVVIKWVAPDLLE